MDKRMVAHCGLVCTECEAYEATQAGDMQALKRMAQTAAEQFDMDLTAADAMCDGCVAATGRRIPYCRACEIRQCAVQKHVESCAHCTGYPCEKIDAFSPEGKPRRATLDAIRASLDSGN